MTELSRRQLLASAATAGAAAAFSSVGMPAAYANGTPAGTQAPGIYRYKVGDYELTAIYDGIWYRPIASDFIRNAPFAEEIGRASCRERVYVLV